MNDSVVTKKIKDLSRTEKAAILVQALKKEGYNDNQIAQLTEVSRSRICQVNKAVREGKLSPILNKSIIKKLRTNIEMLIDGKKIGDMESVKGADVLGAMKMAADRIDPIINKTEDVNTTKKVMREEDAARYRKLLGIPEITNAVLIPDKLTIDAEFEKVEEKKNEKDNGTDTGTETNS
jgi:hypothetical protein